MNHLPKNSEDIEVSLKDNNIHFKLKETPKSTLRCTCLIPKTTTTTNGSDQELIPSLPPPTPPPTPQEFGIQLLEASKAGDLELVKKIVNLE